MSDVSGSGQGTDHDGRVSPAGLLCIGEPLVELRPAGDRIGIGIGGDMLNVAVRARANGLRAGLIYVRSCDALGDWLEAAITSLDVEPVSRTGPGHTGLYSISTRSDGERSFSYWRDRTACAGLEPGDVVPLPAGYPVLLVSGITQALSASAEAAVEAAVACAKDAGMTVAYDPNVRPGLWERRGGLGAARRAAEALLDRVDVFLPSVEDCRYLWGGSDDAVRDLVGGRAGHAVVKAGADGAWQHIDGNWRTVQPFPARVSVDTTGAGDAFNAAYLAELIAGTDPAVCASQAAAAAAATVHVGGALGDLFDDASSRPAAALADRRGVP